MNIAKYTVEDWGGVREVRVLFGRNNTHIRTRIVTADVARIGLRAMVKSIRTTSYCNMPTPALFRSGYMWLEATIKLNIALDYILRRVVSGPKICP